MFLHFEDGVWLCGVPAVLDVKKDFLDTQAVCQEITLARCRSGPCSGGCCGRCCGCSRP